MDFLTPLFGTLEQGLKLLNTKEGNKYLDEVISLRQEYSDEMLKPTNDQSDLRIITIQRRVLVICETFRQLKPNAST